MGCSLGLLVGFAHRFINWTTSATRIKYMTTGVLLREILRDPRLSQYSVLILDEVHERSIEIDILLGLLNQVKFLVDINY